MTAVWFPFRTLRAAPDVRLVCFPPAGQGGSIFRTWLAAAPESLDVLALQLPGRETRIEEAPIDDVGVLADRIAAALAAMLDRPLAFFGHCYGALVAYEVARRLPDDAVVMLGVSGCAAPQLLDPVGWSARTRSFAEDVELLRDAYGDRVADLPTELLEDLMPSLFSDLIALDRYRCAQPAKLRCPIHLFAWERDHTVPASSLHAWAQCTTASFTRTTLGGERDALSAEGATIARTIAERRSCATEGRA